MTKTNRLNKKEKRRSFAGKISNFTDKRERNFEKAHLKAYLKGKEFFTFGRLPNTNEPRMFKVQQVWI